MDRPLEHLNPEISTAGLPTGTVTFLFTDIEGSTKLLARAGDRYPAILEAHHRLLRDAVTAAGGQVVSTEGDAFFVVFRSAPAAVAAAVASQRALTANAWPDGIEVHVRMGLHTGHGILGGDNYTGIDLHRAARIASAAHGGQVIVSEATRTLAEAALPEGVAVRDLGEHRLKDLERPERLYAVIATGLRSDFPPPRTLEAATNLPTHLTTFVGRDHEVAEVRALLERTRLLTLTGPGGTGKTRLSVRVASDLRDAFRDGVFFVELGPISDSTLVPATIAQTLHVKEEPERPIVETLKAHLRDRALLLLLDNFEQIMPAAPVVADQLTAAPRLKVLVTSREALRVYGEQEYPVPPLSLPDSERLPSPQILSQYDAVALFVQRAREVKPGFALRDENARPIAEICRRLDGLPLAIELAAARVKVFTPDALLARLGQRLAVLTGGARDLPARQRTLRGAIDWSYTLLTPEDQALFRRVAVFVGGATYEAVEAICNPAGELGVDILDGVTSLVDKSLLNQEEVGGEPRLRMLETIREYAREALDASGESAMMLGRHASYFLGVAAQAEPEVLGTESAAWLDRLEVEHDNFRGVLRFSLDEGDVETGLLLGGALWRFWQQRSHLSEGRVWLQDLLAHPRASGPSAGRAKGLTALGGLAYWQSDFPAAARVYEESLALYRELGDQAGTADALYNLAYMALVGGDLRGLRAYAEQSVAIYEALGDRAGSAKAKDGLALAHFKEGDYAGARAVAEELIEIYREQGASFRIADAQTFIAMVAVLQGDLTAARGLLREGMAFFRETRNASAIVPILQIAAMIAMAAGNPDRAARLVGASKTQRELTDAGLSPVDLLGVEDPGEGARRALGDETFAAAFEAGRRLTTDEAIACALEEP